MAHPEKAAMQLRVREQAAKRMENVRFTKRILWRYRWQKERNTMRVYSATDIGQKRKMNQDYVFVSETAVGNLPNLLIVADGMGGHNAGDFASSFAVSTIVETIETDKDFNPIKVIRHAIEKANEELRIQAAKSPGLTGMGTTVVVATVVGRYAYIANVGDSRLYLIDSKIHQITKDHSLVQEMVRMGKLAAEDALNHPDKNIITRALGAENRVVVDFFELPLESGSTILMCSDGLSNMVSDQDMERIILNQDMDLREKGVELIKYANDNGGKDNIAVVLAEPFTKEVEEC